VTDVERLFRTYNAALVRYLTRRLGDRDWAEEVAQERDRRALLMREEGLDYNEIAEALELSPGSVGTTLSRARRRLVESYEALQKDREEREKHAAS
jgi:DNA-directed RNA polymerase specialized sigma24 family protein